jgi:hypothetical protein
MVPHDALGALAHVLHPTALPSLPAERIGRRLRMSSSTTPSLKPPWKERDLVAVELEIEMRRGEGLLGQPDDLIKKGSEGLIPSLL